MKVSTNEYLSISNQLNSVFPQASAGDGLPENICLTCIGEMNQAYSFKQKCERSELALRAFQRKVMYTENAVPSTSRSVTNIVCIDAIADTQSKPITCDAKPPKQLSYLIQEQITDSSGKPIYQCMNCWMTFDASTEIEMHLLEDLCAAGPNKALPDDMDADYDLDNPPDDDDSPFGANEATSFKLSPKDVVKATACDSGIICENCDVSFGTQHALNEHQKWKNCIFQSFECDICKNVYSTRRNISRHIHRMHRMPRVRKNAKNTSEEKKFKCTQCPKGA